MPIDPEKVAGVELPATESSWSPREVILYHLGVGAGMERPTDPKELEYTYEKNLKVLPSFAVIPVFGSLAHLVTAPGVEINLAQILHGEQAIELHKPIPVAATVVTSGRVAEVYDKGKAALIVLEVETKEKDTGDRLFTNQFSVFVRGEGGFGGDPGPKAGNRPPDRAPDVVTESRTLPQQALLYRLNGDLNPLHADPDFAKLAGFQVPILHGLCSFGIVCKAVVDELLEGAVDRVTGYAARFAGAVFPGETLVTSMWNQGDEILVSSSVKERDAPVISNCAVRIRN